MRRVPAGGWAELLDSAFALLPDGMRTRVQHVDFLCGVSPHFAGIVDDNTYPAPFEGYAWADVAHVLFADHQVLIPRDRRRATVYLPAQVLRWRRAPWRLSLVVHELGHVLHEAVGFEHDAVPVTDYARRDRWEAFAEALCAWLRVPQYEEPGVVDAATATLFRELERP